MTIHIKKYQLYSFLGGTLTASVILLTIFGFYGRSVTKKIEVQEQKVVQDTALLNSLSETMRSMAAAFRFVSSSEVSGKEQKNEYQMEKGAFDKKEYIDALFKKTFPDGPSGDPQKDANAVYSMALNTVADMEMTVGLELSSVNHRKMIDKGTSLILGELCRRAGISMSTTLVWDLKNRTFWVENEFPSDSEKPLSLIAGRVSEDDDVVFLHSGAFDFKDDPVAAGKSLFDRNGRIQRESPEIHEIDIDGFRKYILQQPRAFRINREEVDIITADRKIQVLARGIYFTRTHEIKLERKRNAVVS